MKIHKLYYRVDQYSPIIELNFSEHQTDEFSYTWAFNSDATQLQIIKQALENCLNLSNPPTSLFYSKIELYDHIGREWQIECNEKNRIILQNSRSLDSYHGFEEFSKAILNVFGVKNENDQYMYNTFEINHYNNELVSFSKNQDSKLHKYLLDNIEKRKKELYKSQLTKSNILRNLESHRANQLVKNLQPIYTQYHGLQNQLEKLHIEHNNKNYIAPETKFDYIQQTELILKVEKLHDELSEPGQSISSQKDQISAIETEISELLNAMQLDQLPSFTQMPQWSEAFNNLCRIHALEKLVRYTNKVTDIAQKEINPLLDTLVETISKMIEQQEEYSDEIQSCISSINVQLATNQINIDIESDKFALDKKTPTQSEKVELVLGWFEKLKSKVAQEEQNSKKNESELRKKNLENLRTNLEFLLARFSEMRAHIARVQSHNKHEYFAEINQNLDKQIASLGKAKQEWKKFQTTYNLPENMTLKQFMLLAVNYMKIIELQERKNIIETSINQRKIKLRQLADLIEQWRKANASQKMLDVENSAVLFSEARSIIRYKDERSKKAEHHEKLVNQAKDDRRLILLIQEQCNQLENEWKSICSEFTIESINIKDKSFEDMLQFQTKINELQNFSQSHAPETFVEVLNRNNSEQIKVWTWCDQSLNNQTRLNFLKSIEMSGVKNCLQIFLVSDATLVDFMYKLGIGNVKIFEKEKAKPIHQIEPQKPLVNESIAPPHVIQSQTLQRRIIKSNSTPTTQQSIPTDISPKAKAVLDILNSRSKT